MQKIACLFFISVFFIGCATAYKMNNVSVGMSKREVIDALDGFAPSENWALDGWETTNPEGGKNDQWIPWPLKIKKERVFVS